MNDSSYFHASPFKGNTPISTGPKILEVKLGPASLIRGNSVIVFAKVRRNGGVKNTKIRPNISNG